MSVIEIRNLTRDPSAHHPSLAYFADFVMHVPRRDIFQEECCLAPTIQNLLGTLLWKHHGENGANDNALLVGECGVAGCCGVDFSVIPEGAAYEISWADEDELSAAVERASRESPHEAIFPNTFRVAMVEVEIPRERYGEAVVRLAVRFLQRRAKDRDPDPKTEEVLGWCEERYPDLVRSVRRSAVGAPLLPCDGQEWTQV